jgi:ABC-type branched-subunit amino acid transport system substrate-binding protein
LGFATLGCASAPPDTLSKKDLSSKTQKPSAAEQQDFQEIESHFSQGTTEKISPKISAFLSKYPHSSFLPALENIRGLLLLKQKNFNRAILQFKKAIDLTPSDPSFHQYVYYNLATAQANSGQIDLALKTLSAIKLHNLDKSNQIKVNYLKASIYYKKALPLEAVRQLMEGGELFTDTDNQASRGPYIRLLEESLQKIENPESIEALYRQYQTSPRADVILLRLGSMSLAKGDSANGELYLKTLLFKFPQSSYTFEATSLLSKPKQATPDKYGDFEKYTIGVLLPLKGKFAKFGYKSLQGIELAFCIFDSSESEHRFTLAIEDSGEEPEQAIQALERLVSKHHVAAVIGPMLSKGVDQISHRAQELGIPIISLARKASSPQEFVFQGGLTQQLQAYEIARHSIQTLGLKKFAILYQSDKFGNEMNQYFWDAVESMGGKIVASESYSPGETDFRKSVDRLSGLYYLDARQRELDLLSEERESNNIKKRTRKTEQFFNLKPIVDYEAVFLPDEPKVAGQILPTFAYRDVEHINFLGTSSWNSPEFLSRAQNYAEKSSFVDAYFSESRKPSIINFIKKYRSIFLQEPGALEILAYDAAFVIKTTLTQSQSALNRTELRDQLKLTKNLPGSIGDITIKDGQLNRNLLVLTVKNGQFVDQ